MKLPDKITILSAYCLVGPYPPFPSGVDHHVLEIDVELKNHDEPAQHTRIAIPLDVVSLALDAIERYREKVKKT